MVIPDAVSDHGLGRAGAVVLCGGGSRRMGRDKAFLPWGGRTLLAHVVGVAAEVVGSERIVVVAAPGQPLPPLPAGVRVVRDEVPDVGPLPAVALGLESLLVEVEIAYVTACDAPLAAPGPIAWLLAELAAAESQVQALVPLIAGQLHPLAAAYRRSAAAALRAALQAGRRSLIGALDGMQHRTIGEGELSAADPDLTLVTNCNTPEEFAELGEKFAHRAGELGARG